MAIPLARDISVFREQSSSRTNRMVAIKVSNEIFPTSGMEVRDHNTGQMIEKIASLHLTFTPGEVPVAMMTFLDGRMEEAFIYQMFGGAR